MTGRQASRRESVCGWTRTRYRSTPRPPGALTLQRVLSSRDRRAPPVELSRRNESRKRQYWASYSWCTFIASRKELGRWSKRSVTWTTSSAVVSKARVYASEGRGDVSAVGQGTTRR